MNDMYLPHSRLEKNFKISVVLLSSLDSKVKFPSLNTRAENCVCVRKIFSYTPKNSMSSVKYFKETTTLEKRGRRKRMR